MSLCHKRSDDARVTMALVNCTTTQMIKVKPNAVREGKDIRIRREHVDVFSTFGVPYPRIDRAFSMNVIVKATPRYCILITAKKTHFAPFAVSKTMGSG